MTVLWIRRAASAVKRITEMAPRAYGIRIVAKLGWVSTLRIAMGLAWLIALLLVPIHWRTDLLNPADIGSDTSNYIGASERLAEGNAMYEPEKGDRPAPLDNPPEWSVPILSPPPTATVYLPMSWLPDVIAYHVTWAAGLAATTALGLYVMLVAPLPFGLLVLYAPQGLAVTAWSGNINALIGPVAAFVWWATRRHRQPILLAAGLAVSVVAAVKLGPAFMGLWLLARRRWSSVLGGAAVGLVLVGATLLLAGLDIVETYLAVVKNTAAAPNELSIPGLLGSLGIVRLQLLGFGAVMLAAVSGIVLVHNERMSFSLAVFAMVFATTVVRPESIAVGIVAVAVAWAEPKHHTAGAFSNDEHPLASRMRLGAISKPATIALAIGITLGLLAIAASLMRGGAVRSSLAMTNTASQPVIIRLTMYAQEASFGFRIEPGRTLYGWFDEFGASPPVATVWTPECDLIDSLVLPRAGAHVQVSATGVKAGNEMPTGEELAAFVPDCAAELVALIDL